MALYALDEARLVYAAEAKEKKIYRCAGCKSPVQVRKGPFRVPHYYHLGKSPTCRLYSKSEDHMLAQLFIQAMLPPGEAFIEYPFLEVNRVADVLWKPAKIIFEIQCSLMSPHEAQSRIHDYEKLGYKIVWILDDHLYNRKMLKPSDGIEGVKKFILETVKEAGPNPCPPTIIGVGIGGTFDKVAVLAKKALLRQIDKSNENPFYANLEKELLEKINELGVGPQGFGGKTTSLGLNIEVYPTHIAGLPVAVNVNCHATRHAEIIM